MDMHLHKPVTAETPFPSSLQMTVSAASLVPVTAEACSCLVTLNTSQYMFMFMLYYFTPNLELLCMYVSEDDSPYPLFPMCPGPCTMVLISPA
jgi:hypothetical protein